MFAGALGVSLGALPTAAAGWCTRCQRQHRLSRTPEAEWHALALLASIEDAGRFDFEAPTGEERFQTEACTGGKMLGVATCEGGVVLRAFSGMLGGSYHCTGWVGPVVSAVPTACTMCNRGRHHCNTSAGDAHARRRGGEPALCADREARAAGRGFGHRRIHHRWTE